jgi:hypothetical protein
VIDDPAELDRRSAWLDAMRAQGRSARFAGLVACLVGVLVLIIGRYRLGGAVWMLWGGAGIVALGWGLFVYAIGRRLFWARAHPFDPNAQAPHG